MIKGFFLTLLATVPLFAGPDFQRYDALLKKYVCRGGVDYKGLKAAGAIDSAEKEFILSPEDYGALVDGGKIAYLINLYNFYTLKLIVDHYPVKSIREIKEPWDQKFVPFLGKKVSLNHLEHNILRKEFKEPRIHFALVCASKSCPLLQPTIFQAAHLDQQFDTSARNFLSDPGKNRLEGNKFYGSKIFEWYGADFNVTYGSFLKFTEESLGLPHGLTKSPFLDYDWCLNETEPCPAP